MNHDLQGKLLWMGWCICLLTFLSCTDELKPKAAIDYDGQTAEFDWATFNANKELWSKRGSSSYRMHLQHADLPGEILTIEVAGGRAVSAKRSGNLHQSMSERFSSLDTVEKILEIVETEAKKKSRVFVRFGNEGFPQLVEASSTSEPIKTLTISVSGVFTKS